MFPGFNLQRWAGVLAGRIATDKKQDDSAHEAARALVEILEPAHVERLVDALLEAAPGLRERFTRTVLEDLCEEVVRREDPRHAHATVELITNIENDWRQES